MKKTTYTKSFTGWGYSRDTAKLFAEIGNVPVTVKESPTYNTFREAETAAEHFSIPGKPVKVKVTYTVTLEPV